METTEKHEQGMKLFLTENAEKDLKTTASWTKFYAILYFIGVGVLFLCGLMMLILGKMAFFPLMHEANSMMPMCGISFGFIGIIYMILGLLMIIPGMLLYQFNLNIKKALWNNNVATFEVAVSKMKSYWMFMGIYAIVMIVISVVIIPIVIIISGVCMA